MTRLALAGLAILWLAAPAAPAFAATIQGRVVDAHDGDTIAVETKDGLREKVRLLGIDCPEIGQPPWGYAARDYTRGLVLGQDVRVETDVQARDKYGRLLGYVYRGDTFVNLEIIRQGHAVLLTYPPNVKHTDAFTAAQTQARAAHRGIWSLTSPLDKTPHAFRHPNDPSPGAPEGALAPDAPVVMNTKSKKIHHAGCGHPLDCKHCEAMSMKDALDRGGEPCKRRR